MSNPYKEGSRKAEIYDVFTKAGGGEKGMAAAHKHAAKKSVGIKEGTVKSWGSMWLRGVTKPEAKEGGSDKPVTLREISTKPGEYHPLFKYTSRAKADAAHEALCTRVGLRPHAFHVIEDQERFAVAPANYKPGGPVPTFKKGDTVYDAFIINSKAEVIDAGPEQSMIRYHVARKSGLKDECVINRFLVKLPDEEKPAKKAKKERARL